MIWKPSPALAGCRVLISAGPDSSPTQEGSKPEEERKGVLEVASPIRADVNAAANWVEALHNVMAAAAIASLLGTQQRTRLQGPISSIKGRGGSVCAICVCWERLPDS